MTLSLQQARTIVNGGGGTPVPQYDPSAPNANPFYSGGAPAPQIRLPDTGSGGFLPGSTPAPQQATGDYRDADGTWHHADGTVFTPDANYDYFGGGTAPTGGTKTATTAGQIQLPTFDQSAGDIGIAPEGYQPLVGFPGYYYNPDTNSFRLMTNTTFDADGNPKASFRALTKAEDTSLRSAYRQYAANGGNTSVGSATGDVGRAGTAADHYATDVSAGTAAANRAEQARQFDIAQAESQRQYNLTHGLAENQYDQSVLGNRNAAGLSVANLANTLAENAYARAKDPGNFPALLASYSGIEQGNPALTTLLGQGYQIPQAPGANPLADPRFQAQMNALYNYGTGPTGEQINNVRMARETLGDPAARAGFANFANLDAANAAAAPPAGAEAVPAHAHGGSQMLRGPVVGIPQAQLRPGQTPQFLAGEAGREKLTFTPTRAAQGSVHTHPDGTTHAHAMPVRYEEGGTAVVNPSGASTLPAHSLLPGGDNTGQSPTPPAPTTGPSQGGAGGIGTAASTNPTMDFFKQWPTYTPDQQQRLLGIARVQNIAQQNNGTLPQSFYNYTGTVNPDPNAVGQTYTPAQGTAEALYKALKPFGYAPREVMDALQAGNAPGPNMIAGRFGQRLQQENPSLWSLLQSAVQARLGSAGLGDYVAQAGRYQQAGFGSAGGVVR